MNKMALVRIIAFVLSWVNNYLVQKGYVALPVPHEETIAEVVAFVVSIWTMFTHNRLKK